MDQIMEQITQQVTELARNIAHIDISTAAYPFYGVLYTVTNFNNLAAPVAKSLSIALATSLATIIPLLVLTLGFQTKFTAKILRSFDPSLPRMSLFGVRFAKWAALMLCAFEAWTVMYMALGKNLAATRNELFQDVLLSHGTPGAYVSDPSFIMPAEHTASPKSVQIKTLHDLADIATTHPTPFDFAKRPVHAAAGFVLQFIPVVGPLAYAYLEGQRTGIMAHTNLFALKGMKPEERAQWVLARGDQYSAFGFTAAALEAVPLVGSVAKYTNAVGAALWASDLEARQAKLRGTKWAKKA